MQPSINQASQMCSLTWSTSDSSLLALPAWQWIVNLLAVCIALTCLKIARSKERVRFPHTHKPGIFITGCDSGFGQQLAIQLAATQQCNVFAGCLTHEGLRKLWAVPGVRPIQVDVTNSESIGQARKILETELEGEGLWGVVNNAGVGAPPGGTDWIERQDITNCFNVNIIGMMDVTRQLLPLVKKARGRIVNVSSINGRLAFGGSIYCASKFAVEGFSDSLRREVASWGVSVSIIEPGFFRTSMTSNENDRIVQAFTQRYEDLASRDKGLYIAYGDKFIEKNVKALREHLSEKRLCPNLRLVTDDMQAALFAAHPHTRYTPGYDAKLLWVPLSCLPTCVSDWLLGLALNKCYAPEGELSAL